jgi:hypothetical protein
LKNVNIIVYCTQAVNKGKGVVNKLGHVNETIKVPFPVSSKVQDFGRAKSTSFLQESAFCMYTPNLCFINH